MQTPNFEDEFGIFCGYFQGSLSVLKRMVLWWGWTCGSGYGDVKERERERERCVQMREKMIFLLSVILEINRVNIEVEAIYIYITT